MRGDRRNPAVDSSTVEGMLESSSKSMGQLCLVAVAGYCCMAASEYCKCVAASGCCMAASECCKCVAAPGCCMATSEVCKCVAAFGCCTAASMCCMAASECCMAAGWLEVVGESADMSTSPSNHVLVIS